MSFRRINSQFSNGSQQDWFLSSGPAPNGLVAAEVGDICFVPNTGAGVLHICQGGASWSESISAAFPLLGPNGTSTEPTYSFVSDPDTGLYRSGANQLSAAAGGNESARFVDNGIQSATGTLANPTYSFIGDPDTGIAHHQSVANALIVVAGGAQVSSFDTNGLNMANDGTAADPVIALGGEANTGLYTPGTAIVGITAGGSRGAQVSMTGVQVPDGSAARPSITFINDNDVGLFYGGPDLGVAVNGSQIASFYQNGLLNNITGTNLIPSYSWNGKTNSGMYIDGPAGGPTVSISVNSVEGLRVSQTGVRVPAGSMTVPSVSFIGDSDTGLYRSSLGETTVTANSNNALRVNQSLVEVQSAQLWVQNGDASAPGYSFTNSIDSGLYWDGTGVNVSVENSKVLLISPTGPQLPFGTAANPSLSFIADPDTGLYRVQDNNIGIAAGGSNGATISATGVFADRHVARVNGSETTPAFTWADSTGSGMYLGGTLGEVYISATGMTGVRIGSDGTQIVGPVSIGSLAAADASAILDVSSTTSGFLQPRMTNTQRDAISATDGLQLYNTSTGVPQWYNGGTVGQTGWRDYNFGKTRSVSDPAGTTTMNAYDHLLYFDNNTGAARQLNLPAVPYDGQEHIIRTRRVSNVGDLLSNNGGPQIRNMLNASLMSFNMTGAAVYHYIYCVGINEWIQSSPAQ